MAFNCDPNRPYQRCTRCIMDTTDPLIVFDEAGICNHCHAFDILSKSKWFPNELGQSKLEALLANIKRDGQGLEYDCIMGLSGGVDSSYLAYKAKAWGLRILAVHVDAGWNSELATRNIELLVKKCDLDLYTYVVDWEEMRDLQVAFFKSSTANLDIPQDHAYFTNLYKLAFKYKIKYVLTGSNLSTEGILPRAWGYDHNDALYIKSIYRKFGKKRHLTSYETLSWFTYYIRIPYLKALNIVCPLNYMVYDKEKAKKELIDVLGWKDYGVKHGESRFTSFFQKYYLPCKFGYDKRLAHFSSLIVAGSMTREEALRELDRPLYEDEQLRNDKEFVLKKLRLDDCEFEQIMNQKPKDFSEYDSAHARNVFFRKIKHLFVQN